MDPESLTENGEDLLSVGQDILQTQSQAVLEKEKGSVLREALAMDDSEVNEAVFFAIRAPLVEPDYVRLFKLNDA